jgi:hypothetical protein
MSLLQLRRGVGWAGLLLAGLVACGGADASRPTGGQGGAAATGGGAAISGSGGVAAAVPGTCVAPSAAGYQPMWRPPNAPMVGACTEEQVSRQYALCEFNSGMYSEAACEAFGAQPANFKCLSCMFGAPGAASVGAILDLPGDEWVANQAGCLALVDGDSSATGCGAKRQAAELCVYTACNTACARPVSNEVVGACDSAAQSDACSAYFSEAACALSPRYAACDYTSAADYFTAMADLFCVSGLPAGAGAAGAAGAGP